MTVQWIWVEITSVVSQWLWWWDGFPRMVFSSHTNSHYGETHSGIFGTNMFSQYQMFSTMQNIEKPSQMKLRFVIWTFLLKITSRHFSQSSPLSSSTFSCSCSPGRVKMLMVRYFQQQDMSSVWSWTKLIEDGSRKIKYLFSARLVKLILARKKGKNKQKKRIKSFPPFLIFLRKGEKK